ncbi:MAG: hypothetical protein JWP88_2276 [Flaviaesturariibacter sp.]|nr:hypothetical protein [Flaviaesturariibacter sp.]
MLAALSVAGVASAQNNSPYSRYGLGDIVPNTHVVNRSMGGITAGDADYLHINFNNPASYSQFAVGTEPRSGKVIAGRVLLDGGINLENRTLRAPNQPLKFTSSDLYFSYLQIGIPIRKGWGIAFGIRPLSRISYTINQYSRTAALDSLFTQYSGNGGTYLPSIGTGVAIKNFSIGVNVGYLFGRREISTFVAPLNDTVLYYNILRKSETSFGNLFLNGGVQYKIDIDKSHFLRLGASGNARQALKASQDSTIGTFTTDPNDPLTDTVYRVEGYKGKVIYPASYTIGFVFAGMNEKTSSAWQVGADLVHTSWSQYRFYGAKEPLQSTTQIRLGGQFQPAPSRAYLSRVVYRAGFYTGKDYTTAGGNLPVWGASAGLGLPIGNYNPLGRGQSTIINLALEYNSRGNNKNPLKDNVFRLSLGLNFSDLWFNKRKYD